MSKPTAVGIDVSKERLDVYIEGGQAFAVSRDRQGLKTLLEKLTALEAPAVGLEATGGYEQAVLEVLAAAGVSVYRLHPLRVRRFAEAGGRLAKNDRIDARIIAQFVAWGGGESGMAPWKLPSKGERDLRALVTRRRQLVEMKVAEQQREMRAEHYGAQRSIGSMLTAIKAQLKVIDRAILATLKRFEDVGEKVTRMRTMDGVGAVLATTLAVSLPELGTLSHKQVAALVGVAPMQRQSGATELRRRTCGGRGALRAVLYMATLACTQHNDEVRARYTRMIQAGKPPKVALVACMRKVLITLNAMVRDQRDWQAKTHAPTSLEVAAG